jgi:hypothetical protein
MVTVRVGCGERIKRAEEAGYRILTADVSSRLAREETATGILTALAASARVNDVRAVSVSWVRHDG